MRHFHTSRYCYNHTHKETTYKYQHFDIQIVITLINKSILDTIITHKYQLQTAYVNKSSSDIARWLGPAGTMPPTRPRHLQIVI